MTDPQGDVQGYTAGIFGGCIFPADQTRFFSYDQIAWTGENWTAEARIQSSFEGP